jgi:uncharacterized membrane protein YidH (DUF202 family)
MIAKMGLPDGGADPGVDPDLILGEAQVLLSEKRTSLAIIRSGIAVMALPLSIVSVLIATSRLYDVSHVLHLLIPVLMLCGAVAALGAYMVVHGLLSLRRQDRYLQHLKALLPTLAEILD